MKIRRTTKSFMSSRWDTDSEYRKKKDPIIPVLIFILGVLGVIELIRHYLS